MRSAHLPWPEDHAGTHSHSRHETLKLLAFLLPPLAVKMAGEGHSVPLNILLTICGWIPGVIHARRIVARSGHGDFTADQLILALQHHVRR